MTHRCTDAQTHTQATQTDQFRDFLATVASGPLISKKGGVLPPSVDGVISASEVQVGFAA